MYSQPSFALATFRRQAGNAASRACTWSIVGVKRGVLIEAKMTHESGWDDDAIGVVEVGQLLARGSGRRGC
jgi:hypothetical protein